MAPSPHRGNATSTVDDCATRHHASSCMPPLHLSPRPDLSILLHALFFSRARPPRARPLFTDVPTMRGFLMTSSSCPRRGRSFDLEPLEAPSGAGSTKHTLKCSWMASKSTTYCTQKCCHALVMQQLTSSEPIDQAIRRKTSAC